MRRMFSKGQIQSLSQEKSQEIIEEMRDNGELSVKNVIFNFTYTDQDLTGLDIPIPNDIFEEIKKYKLFYLNMSYDDGIFGLMGPSGDEYIVYETTNNKPIVVYINDNTKKLCFSYDNPLFGSSVEVTITPII